MTLFFSAEQRTRTVVAVRLPDAGSPGHGTSVHCAVLATHPRSPGRQSHTAPAASRGSGLRGAASTGKDLLHYSARAAGTLRRSTLRVKISTVHGSNTTALPHIISFLCPKKINKGLDQDKTRHRFTALLIHRYKRLQYYAN